MGKTDNTKQIIYDIREVRVENISGELSLVNEDVFDEPIKIKDLFNGYIGQSIDIKIGGAEKIKPDMFD